MKIPRWLKIQERVDYLLWELGQMFKTEEKLSGIERMIDKATGFDKQKMKIADKKIKECRKLVKEYNKITKGGE